MLTINSNHFISGVKVMPTPNKSGALKPRLVVVHDTAGRLDHMTSVAWLRNPQASASAHFVVGMKGEIVQLASCLVKTWHAGKSSYRGEQNVNDFAIGIEIANPGRLGTTPGAKKARASFGQEFDIAAHRIAFAETPEHGRGWWMPYPDAQLQAVLDLCMAIRDRYNITNVATHWEISPGRKFDTNPLFPLAWLRGKMAGRKDDNSTVILSSGARIRKWPSFNHTNVVAEVATAQVANVIRSGSYKAEGSDIPRDVPPGSDLLWFNIDTPEVHGWVLATEVALI
jgi:N-acetylmuramoyl-L-alanine amidase